MTVKNTQKRAAIIWLFIGALGLFMVFMPSIFDIDIMNGGGALIFLGLFVFVSAIIVAIMFFKRAKVMDGVIQGNVLIRWNYDELSWRRYAEQEYSYRKENNKLMFILISSICLIVGIIFFILDPEGGFYVFLAMLGMIAILAVTAFLTAYIPYMRNKRRLGEVLIFNDGIYINGVTHIWKGFTARLDSVEFSQESERCIEFVYSAATRTGRQSYTVLVPIPLGRENEAAYIVNYFNCGYRVKTIFKGD